MPEVASVRASYVLHKHILTNVLRLPLAFFETTPIGRVLSRFSKDMDVVDNPLQKQFTSALLCLLKVGVKAYPCVCCWFEFHRQLFTTNSAIHIFCVYHPLCGIFFSVVFSQGRKFNRIVCHPHI